MINWIKSASYLTVPYSCRESTSARPFGASLGTCRRCWPRSGQLRDKAHRTPSPPRSANWVQLLLSRDSTRDYNLFFRPTTAFSLGLSTTHVLALRKITTRNFPSTFLVETGPIDNHTLPRHPLTTHKPSR